MLGAGIAMGCIVGGATVGVAAADGGAGVVVMHSISGGVCSACPGAAIVQPNLRSVLAPRCKTLAPKSPRDTVRALEHDTICPGTLQPAPMRRPGVPMEQSGQAAHLQKVHARSRPVSSVHDASQSATSVPSECSSATLTRSCIPTCQSGTCAEKVKRPPVD